MSVVIVNTLLTSVMGKLAKFERHVSLSDYTSTVTAKLALAQFLNTALIVVIVNAGYTGGGLGLLQVGVGGAFFLLRYVRVCCPFLSHLVNAVTRAWLGRIRYQGGLFYPLVLVCKGKRAYNLAPN